MPSKSAQMAEIHKGRQKEARNSEVRGHSWATGRWAELVAMAVAAQMPLQSCWSLTHVFHNGALRPGSRAEGPPLQSMSSLPWEMVSSPFSSFADFICISPDLFLFPSAWAASQSSYLLDIASGWACLGLLWQHNPKCHSGN